MSHYCQHSNLSSSPTRQCIESPFCPRAKVINICVSLLAGTSTVALPRLLSCSRTHLLRRRYCSQNSLLGFQAQEPLFQRWRLSPRSQRYISPSPPVSLLSIPLLISSVASSYFRPFLPESSGQYDYSAREPTRHDLFRPYGIPKFDQHN